MAQPLFSNKILDLMWRWGNTGESFDLHPGSFLWFKQPLAWRKVIVSWPVSKTLNFHHDHLCSIHKIIVKALLVLLGGFLTHYSLIRLSLWYRLLNPELEWNTCFTSTDTSMGKQSWNLTDITKQKILFSENIILQRK